MKKAQLELKTDAILGEGSIWNAETQELYWIDIEGKKLHIYDPATRKNRTLDLPTRIGTVVPAGKDRALIGLEDGVYAIDTRTGEISRFAAIEADRPGNRLNDGKCDPAGRLWIGTMSLEEEEGAGTLYRVDPDGAVSPQIRNVTISNGIVWTSDHRTMYYIDTPTGQVRAYDFDLASGSISNERVAVEIDESEGFPDGMTIDAEDMIWVALWKGSAVARFDPRSGKLLEKIEVPALKVPSCAFGGPELDTLYITTASIDMSPEQQTQFPDAGSLFSVKPGVKGVGSPFFG
ncbi:SMP-30/gluconolactonase/LRE family protein [Flavilitoribacter nigricans]|uniref:Regucalcin n=1 Tax=Flavilitoribacter nigricans (strain ATCC 23147 / DSM 23189 / NBRC 102662 / NCIMB 1420 / SS-2) TaxID=1122177 RepID=A0A2D0N7V0_FLAN2|nr:SMP-30/gluconolactonase/LRE family protein [Flavilitoribacter nigricans]PHN04591.1 regucalcin [Flavilitoribacter nigricans DSM 23189 = NBRC 102662]